jgi:hypothetical protein
MTRFVTIGLPPRRSRLAVRRELALFSLRLDAVLALRERDLKSLFRRVLSFLFGFVPNFETSFTSASPGVGKISVAVFFGGPLSGPSPSLGNIVCTTA